MICHYTSFEALLGIVHPDALLFRATRFSHLDDPYEFKWALEKLKIKECDYMEEYPYVISFCKAYDFLKKILLDEIEKEQNSKPYLDTMKIGQDVVYANDNNFNNKVSNFINEFQKSYYGQLDEEDKTAFIEASAFIKRDDYEIEQEWRYTLFNFSYFTIKYNKQDPSSPIFEDEKENTKNIKIHTNRSKQYTVIELPIESLKGIVIGYNIPNEWIVMLRTYLPHLNSKYHAIINNIKKSKYSKKDENNNY